MLTLCNSSAPTNIGFQKYLFFLKKIKNANDTARNKKKHITNKHHENKEESRMEKNKVDEIVRTADCYELDTKAKRIKPAKKLLQWRSKELKKKMKNEHKKTKLLFPYLYCRESESILTTSMRRD